MDADKVEPLLFTAWLRAFAHDVLFARTGRSGRRLLGSEAAGHRSGADRASGMVRRPAAGGRELRGAAGERARCRARRAAPGLRPGYGAMAVGPRPYRALRQPGLRPDRAVARLARRSASRPPGAIDTVNRGPTTIRDAAHPYEQRFGAGLRIITDLASPGDSRMIAVPGQSGNPLSPHYRRPVQRWRRVRLAGPRPRGAGRHALTLEPARNERTAGDDRRCPPRRRRRSPARWRTRRRSAPPALSEMAGCEVCPQARDAAPDRLVQGARRAQQAVDASARTSAAPGSSRCRPATTPRASPITPAGSASRRRS